MLTLSVLPINAEASALYANHSTFHEGDSGLDLFVIADQTVTGHSTAMTKLGIKVAAHSEDGSPVSWLLFPRSSISKTPLRLANSIGLIDAGYRGEVMAAVDNIRGEAFTVKKGDRLVQAVGFHGGAIRMKTVDSLDSTSRGDGGFGSTTHESKKPRTRSPSPKKPQ